MRKRLLSILLLCCMVLTLLPTAAFATGDVDINAPDALTGTVKINGELKYGKKIYFDVTDSNEDGGLSCKWYREGKAEPIGNAIEYELVQADIGKKITCVVSGTTKTGTIEATVGPVEKADGPAAPVISLRTKTDTRILVTENSAWEYSIDNGNSWQRSCLFKDLIPGTKYTIIARVRETATHKPSGNSAPLNVTTMHLDISDELKVKLRAVASAYKGEYDGNEHEAVIVDMNKMPEGWSIAGYTTDEGESFGDSIPKIKDAGTLNVGVKFAHPDYLMKITHYYTAEVAPKPLTTITEDDLAELNIPANLVTVKCQTTGDSKAYGKIPGGFDLSNSTPYKENGVWKAIVQLNLPAYKDKYDADTKKTHEYAGGEGNPHAAFTLKYVNDKWELDGTFPNVVILVKCDGQHPQTPRYTITFNGNGGTPSVTSMTTIDQKLPELPTATHSGRYSFDGWYTAASGGTKITTATVFYENTTVYAHWTYTGGGGGWYYTYYTIKATAGTNGSISPSGWTSVRDGWDQTFTITPDKGYAVAKVLVDGKSVGSVKSYTFKNVTKDHTIEVVFMKANGNPATGVFVDVAEGSYYEEAVDWAVENGITTGTGNNYFTPDGICTRVQAVTFLRRAMDE